jgi:hypothetical protein
MKIAGIKNLYGNSAAVARSRDCIACNEFNGFDIVTIFNQNGRCILGG